MTKEIRQYIAEIETLLNNGNLSDPHKTAEKMLTRIAFYQHERLVHLIVTIGFAIMTVISFAASFGNGLFLALALLFLALDIPYVFHYYFLENSVQKLYKLYYRVVGNERDV